MKTLLFWLICLAGFYTTGASALTITGHLTLNGAPMVGVPVYGSNGLRQASSNRDGLFTFKVAQAGTYVISPISRRPFIPQPLRRSVSIQNTDVQGVDFDFAALAQSEAVISGRITGPGGIPLQGVTVRTTGAKNVATDENGIYFFQHLKTGRYFVFPSLNRNTFSPAYREFKVRAGTRTGSDFRAIPQKTADNYPVYFTGLWNLNTHLIDSNCSFNIPAVNGFTLIYQNQKSLFFKLQKYGTFRSTINGDSFSSHININRFFCRITGDINADFSNQSKAAIQGSMQVSCFAGTPCTMHFDGSITRDL